MKLSHSCAAGVAVALVMAASSPVRGGGFGSFLPELRIAKLEGASRSLFYGGFHSIDPRFPKCSYEGSAAGSIQFASGIHAEASLGGVWGMALRLSYQKGVGAIKEASPMLLAFDTLRSQTFEIWPEVVSTITYETLTTSAVATFRFGGIFSIFEGATIGYPFRATYTAILHFVPPTPDYVRFDGGTSERTVGSGTVPNRALIQAGMITGAAVETPIWGMLFFRAETSAQIPFTPLFEDSPTRLAWFSAMAGIGVAL